MPAGFGKSRATMLAQQTMALQTELHLPEPL